jgi:NADH:ubiquinone oxidoreductase subunit 5 (subunit L)/multisubunit Na+/H+ antiporter MnhA subunit
MIATFLLLPILIPIAGVVFLALSPRLRESLVSDVATAVALLWGASCVGLVALAALGWTDAWSMDLLSWGENRFQLSLRVDLVGGVFLLLSAFLGGVIVRYSHYYMHREPGHRRFFMTMLCFFIGLSLASLAADLEAFFIGWEVVGIASFLLIGFYRNRIQPVRNAQKVYSIYRLCDIGMIFGAYLQGSLLLGTDFAHLASPDAQAKIHSLGQGQLLFLSAVLLLSAAGKSAQLPFSYWMPRAMEGPTPSSAIFYGALSVHAGVLLLIRTFPIWHASTTAPYLIGGLGLLTALLATGMGRVQANIKGQIAYASITQVGVMFVELALGYPRLALLHLVGNACLRCYQLLVSPSVVAYLLRLQSSSAGARARFSDWSLERALPSRLRSSLYSMVVSECYLPHLLEDGLWRGARRFADHVARLISRPVPALAGAVLTVVSILRFSESALWKTVVLAIAVLISFQSIAVPRNSVRVWLSTTGASFALAAVLAASGIEELHELMPFVAVLLAWSVLGILAVTKMRSEWLSFFSVLGATGFPISPLFFGEDVMLHAALRVHPAAAAVFGFIFVLNGIALIRMHCRTFELGGASYVSNNAAMEK